MFPVRNDQGRIFYVRIVRNGDRYGHNDCMVNDNDPMIEFYDSSQDPKNFGEPGQFITRYYIDALRGPDGFGSDARFPKYLMLDGGNPVWTLDSFAASQAVDWAVTLVYGEAA
jgi:hypothetical protein